jgi:dTDP-4-dehydrorhamnose reductase
MKTLILGNGFVGKPLYESISSGEETSNSYTAIWGKRLNELTNLDTADYDVIINTAAKTSIDWCEANKAETFDTNVIQAVRIAKLLTPTQKYVFFSSACIFKSEYPYDINYEDAIPNPQCFYTYTKLMAEQLIYEARPDSLIIRPRLLISEKSHPRNTINKLLKYPQIIDTQESATILEDLITKIKELISYDEKGAFNIFNEGTISPSRIAEIFDHPHTQITKRALDELTKGQARRVSTVLGTKRTLPLPNIEARLLEIRKTWDMSQNG